MKQKKLKFSAFILLGLGLTTGTKAQTAIAATGGNASGSGGKVSYSVGQVFYTNESGTNGKVSQGVQQPYEIFGSTSLDESVEKNHHILVYPNPTTDLIILEMENFIISKTLYQLYDVKGSILETKTIVGKETNIDMSKLSASTYFIKIIAENKEIKTIKIIKN
jgi:hypothetical protein